MEGLPPGVDPSTIPLLPKLNGDPPNFVDPPTLTNTVLGVGVTLIAISAFFVILRIGTNIKSQRKLRIDDYFCILAEILAVGYWVIEFKIAQVAGRHAWDIPITVVFDKSFIQKGAAQQIIASPTFFAAKAAVLTLYLRVFSTLRWLKITSYALLLFIFLPKTAPSAPVLGVLGLVTDMIIFAIPLPIIWKLKLQRKKRTGLVIVFSVGFLAVVTSAVSLYYRVEAFQGHDPVWNAVNATITAFTEVFCTIIVSCAPALSSFWTNIFKEIRFYSSLRTELLSRTSLAKNSKSGNSQHFEGSSTRSGSSSRVKQPHTYDETEDGSPKFGASHTTVYSSKIDLFR